MPNPSLHMVHFLGLLPFFFLLMSKILLFFGFRLLKFSFRRSLFLFKSSFLFVWFQILCASLYFQTHFLPLKSISFLPIFKSYFVFSLSNFILLIPTSKSHFILLSNSFSLKSILFLPIFTSLTLYPFSTFRSLPPVLDLPFKASLHHLRPDDQPSNPLSNKT